MRRILWIAGLVVALLVMVALLVPAIVDVNAYRPQIEQQLSAAGGKKVHLGPMTLSVVPPITLRISDVTVQDPEYPENQPLMQASSMEIRVDPWAYLQGRTEVTSVRLAKPRITLRKSPGGMNASRSTPAGSAGASANTSTGTPTKVSNIRLDDMTVVLFDEQSSVDTPLFSLENADLAMPEFDPTLMENPFQIKATMDFTDATLTTQLIPEPLHFDSGTGEAGNNRFDLNDIRASVQDSSITGKISAAPLDKPAVTFQLHFQEVDFRKLQGWLKAKDSSARSDEPFKSSVENIPQTEFKLKLGGTLTSERTLLGSKVVENTSATIRVEDNLIVIDEFKGNLYSGTISSSGQVSLNAKNPAYQFRSALHGVNLGRLLEEQGKPERLTGQLDAEAQISGAGLPRGADDLFSNLRGSGRFAITQGSLKTFNLLEKLKILSILPILKVVEGPMTSFASLKSDFRINGRRIETDRMLLDTGMLKLALSGYCTLDEELDYIAKADEAGGQEPGSLVGSILGMVARNINNNVEFRLTGTLSHPEVAAYRR